ncbi:unnamed protein product [Nippostrongylus brasiliensis]|uniref:Solute carrier family 25 member 46 (inferred by orthology to a human protein) n=1 Tax=Nippostrongylus brasiliensis TaxID=27835 RepID=A0A0N4Y6H2_NIPBR|nr:unnamed protein product [Nippostrongylus brasiliensis]
MVLRRQCQVHQHARSLHLTPFTLLPVVCNMVTKEGILTFWKGSIGSCVLWGLSNVTEIVLADLLGLPRHIVPNGSTEKYWRHIFLKASTFFAMTPFFISTFTETVRSEAGLGGEGPNVMEVLFKGIDRLRFPVFGSRDASRRFSVLHLAVPTVIYRTSHYIIQTKLYNEFFKMARKYVRNHFDDQFVAGTRTLIDNLDTGLSAISITVKYNGFTDCVRSVLNHEGFWALYSGVGALALEYILHSLLHQAVRACFDRGSEVCGLGSFLNYTKFQCEFLCKFLIDLTADSKGSPPGHGKQPQRHANPFCLSRSNVRLYPLGTDIPQEHPSSIPLANWENRLKITVGAGLCSSYLSGAACPGKYPSSLGSGGHIASSGAQ